MTFASSRVTAIHPNSQVKTLHFSLYSSQALQLQSSDLQLAQCKTCLWFPSALPILVHNNLLPRFCNTRLPSFPTSILALFQIISCTQPEGNFCSIGHILSLLHRTLNGFPLPSEQTQKHNLQALCDVIPEYFFNTTSYTPALLHQTLHILAYVFPVLPLCQLFIPGGPFFRLIPFWLHLILSVPFNSNSHFSLLQQDLPSFFNYSHYITLLFILLMFTIIYTHL